MEPVHEHLRKGNIASAASDGMVASGSGDTGLSGVSFATEGKVSPPKEPGGADVALTRSDRKDIEVTTEIAACTVLVHGGANSEDTSVLCRPETE